MRILFAATSGHLPDVHGGLQTTTHDFCLALRDIGVEAAVLCGTGPDAARRLDRVPWEIDDSLGYLVVRARDPVAVLPAVAQSWNAGAVVVQGGFLQLLISALDSGVPAAAYLHNVESSEIRGHLVPDPEVLYLANSRFTAERWAALSGIECRVIPPLVRPVEAFHDDPGGEVLFVNPSPLKGVELMFGLAAACPEIPFLAIESWGLTSTWRSYCERRAAALGNVCWLRPVDDMRPVFARARMLLMPSVWEESFGRTVIEAQMRGLPVLASDRGALPEVVGDGGFVLSPHAALEEWAAALRAMYADPGQWAGAARSNAMAHVASAPVIAADLVTALAGHSLKIRGAGAAMDSREAAAFAPPEALQGLRQRLARFALSPSDGTPQDTAAPEAAIDRILQHRANGRIDDARQAARALVRHSPSLSYAWHLLGRLEEEQGETDEAIRSYTKAASLDPGHARCRIRLAGLLQRRKQPEAARMFVESALELAPGDADAERILPMAQLDTGRLDEARRFLVRRLRRRSYAAHLWYLLAEVHRRRKRILPAVRCINRALRHGADGPDVRRLAATLARDVGDASNAMLQVERLRERVPEDPDLPVLAVRVLTIAGRLPEALREAEREVARRPGEPATWRALAEIRIRLGDWDAAEEACQEALRQSLDDPEGWRQLGTIYQATSRCEHVVLALRRACALAPDDHDVRIALARAQAAHGQAVAALASLGTIGRKRIEWDEAALLEARVLAEGGNDRAPDFAASLARCEQLLRRPKDRKAALAVLLRLLALGEAVPAATLELAPLEERRQAWREALSASIHVHGHAAVQRLALQARRTWTEDPWFGVAGLYADSLVESPEDDPFGRKARDWTRESRARRRRGSPAWRVPRNGDSRPRIAYVMSQAHEALLRGVLLAHSPKASEVHLFTNARFDGLPSFVRVHPLDPDALDEACAVHGIDLAIDCGGLQPFEGQHAVLEAFARRVAPVQAGWLGTLQTSGGLFDALLTDKTAVPDSADADYEERIVRLDGGQWCWTPPPSAPEPGPLPAAVEGFATFGVPARSLRLDRGSLQAFGRILASVPGSRLRFIGHLSGDWPQRREVLSCLAEHGVDPTRVSFDAWRPLERFHEWLQGIDVALDTFPASGGRSLLDVLWMGVPVVTLRGGWIGARQGAAILDAIDAREWIASSPDEYVRSAVALALNRGALARQRAGLRARVAGSRLLDGQRVALQVESFAQSVLAHCRALRSEPDPKARERRHAAWELDGWLSKRSARIRLPAVGADEVPEFSVIVVLYGQGGLTRRTLQALADQRGPSFETLIVDNASADRTPELLDRVEGAHLLRNDENAGFLLAVNQAARLARGKHLLLLNNDAILLPGALAALADAFERDPSVGAVGGRLVLANGTLQEAGSRVFRDGSAAGIGRGEEPFGHGARVARTVDYCSGALLATPRALWEQLGGFDQRYQPAYYEDTDYCLRVWQAGLRVLYEPRAIALHLEWGSAQPGQAERLMERNRAVFLERHGPWLSGQSWPARASLGTDPWRSPEDRTERRPRILMIENEVPHASRGGGLPRARLMLRALEGWPVTLFPLWIAVDEWSAVRETVPPTVEVALGYGLDGLERFLEARRGTYDVLLVCRPPNMEAIAPLRARRPDLFSGMRLVYDAEALFALREISAAAVLGRPLTRDHAQGRIIAELKLSEGATRVLAVSERDASYFRAAGRRVDLLAHAAAPRRDAPGLAGREGLLFVGALHPGTPNEDGLAWFIDEVLPRLAHLPHGLRHLRVVGTCLSEKIAARAGSGVEVLGVREDLRPCYDTARVFVAPVRFAGGIPAKVVEAAAAGIPVVASAVLVRQLGWQRDRAIGYARDAAGFARHIERLVTCDADWTRQQAAAFEECRMRYDPERFRSVLREALRGKS